MVTKIANNPFDIVFQAVNELYPNTEARIQFDPTLNMEEQEYGYTEFGESGTLPIVGINPELPVSAAIEILAHELAHVIVGYIADHGPEWEKVFSEINDKYTEIMKNMQKKSK